VEFFPGTTEVFSCCAGTRGVQ